MRQEKLTNGTGNAKCIPRLSSSPPCFGSGDVLMVSWTRLKCWCWLQQSGDPQIPRMSPMIQSCLQCRTIEFSPLLWDMVPRLAPSPSLLLTLCPGPPSTGLDQPGVGFLCPEFPDGFQLFLPTAPGSQVSKGGNLLQVLCKGERGETSLPLPVPVFC